MKRLRILQLKSLSMLLFLCFNAWIINAQTTVTINATGTTGSFKTGGVNSTGTKVDGNMTNVSTTTGNNRGWAVFDLSSIPVGANITAVNVIFTTFSSTLSTANNTIRGTTGNPATIAGTTLFNQLNTGTLLNNTMSWPAAGTVTTPVIAAGLAFFQSNVGANNVIIGFIRGSTNAYNIYGYPGTAAQQPKLEITYLQPCSGTPTAGTINGPSMACPSLNFTLSLAGASTSGGLAYQWQSKLPAASTFTNVTGGTLSTLTTSITVPTDFRCVVLCTGSGQSAITPVKSIGINSFYACYCKGSLGGNTSASIDSVNILQTTLANASPGTAAGSYTQYAATGSMTTDLQAGGLYMIYVKYGSSAVGSAWLDANQNGIFEAAEWTRINTTGTSGLAVLRVPPGALIGLTGLRIRSADASATNAAGNACTSFTSGETEDYIVNITPAPVNDIKLVTLLSPSQNSMCPFKNVDVKVVIYNNGSASQQNFPITTNLNGPSTNTSVYTYTGTLAAFTTDTLVLTSYAFGFTGLHTIRSYVSLSNDVNRTNDSSVLFQVDVKPNAGVPVVRNDSACYYTEAMLHVLPDAYQHKWYSNPNYTNPVFVGDTMKIQNIQADSFLYVCSFYPDDRASLTTTTAAGNGCGGGAMFNIVPNVNVKVDSFAALFASTGSQAVNVYYRVGTFAGNETNAAAWILLGTATVNATSTTALTNFTVNAPLNLAMGTTYGIYINYNASYSNGTTTFSNSDMAIQTGTGLCSQFGGTNAGRMFNGTVYYTKGSALCESPLVPIKAFAGPTPLVNLGVDLFPCEGLDVILDPGYAGGTFIWNTNETTQTISTKNKSGIYWVEVDKYCKGSDTVEITYQPLPSVGGIAYTRVGNDYTFSASGAQNVLTAVWIFGDGTQNGTGMSVKHIYAQSGIYKVKLIVKNDCGEDTTTLEIPLGVPNTPGSSDHIALFPNPASNTLTVRAENMQLSGYEVINNLGMVILKQHDMNNLQGDVNIDISNLPVGNYNIKLFSKDNTVTKPFVIHR